MIKKLIPFVPAKNYGLCQSFFTDIGFQAVMKTDEFTQFKLGEESFYLQKFYSKNWAENCVLKLWVDNLDQWAVVLNKTLQIKKYSDARMVGPKMFPWGVEEIHLIDPSGVLWQFAKIAF